MQPVLLNALCGLLYSTPYEKACGPLFTATVIYNKYDAEFKAIDRKADRLIKENINTAAAGPEAVFVSTMVKREIRTSTRVGPWTATLTISSNQSYITVNMSF